MGVCKHAYKLFSQLLCVICLNYLNLIKTAFSALGFWQYFSWSLGSFFFFSDAAVKLQFLLLFLIKAPITYWLCKIFWKCLMRWNVHYFQINSQSGYVSSQSVGPECCESPPSALHGMYTPNIQTIYVAQEQLSPAVSPEIYPLDPSKVF